MTLDFSKTILEKVSFDRYLFNKELKKLVIWLGEEDEEVKDLYNWCQDKYGNQYPDIINQAFENKKFID